MKKFAYASAVMAISTIFFAGTFAQALPTAGDQVTLKYGPYHSSNFSGGDFLLESYSSNHDYAFVTFCLEKDEYFTPTTDNSVTTYDIESVTNYANEGGKGYDGDSTPTEDYISNATKWLMNQYIFNYETLSSEYTDKEAFSKLVQNTIWYFEDEQNDPDTVFLNQIQTKMGSHYNYVDGYFGSTAGYLDNVKVVNIVKGTGDNRYRQSQLIANPVPEPATMMLFGTGMAGLAALRRKKR